MCSSNNRNLEFEIRQVDKWLHFPYRNEYNDKYSEYFRVHSWTNERLKFVYENAYNGGSSVLTVVGSGDHAFNSILYGAKNIDMFDINRFALYFFDLKMAAMIALNYENFMDFMPISFVNTDELSEECLNLENYPMVEEVLKCISEQSLNFWIKLLYGKTFYEREEIANHFLIGPRTSEDSKETLKCVNYLNYQDYEYIRNHLLEVKFNKKIIGIEYVFDVFARKKYDLINFSNIIDYTIQIFINQNKDVCLSLLMFKNYLENQIIPMLNENGKVINYCFFQNRDAKSKADAITELFEKDRKYESLLVPETDIEQKLLTFKKYS